MRSAIAAAYLSRRRLPAPIAVVLVAAVLVALALGGSTAAEAASTFLIEGGGNGHGIGLSQYGADGYALHGRDHRWILAHYYRGTSLGTVERARTVRVLVGTTAAAFSGANRIGRHRVKPGRTYTVRPNADGTLAVLTPAGRKLGTFPAPLTATGPGPLSLAGVGSYHGRLEFRPSGSGGIETVNVVGLEDYVRGVISAEMPAGWAAEAVAAQAIAARTYAITSDAGGAIFDLYADTRSQMYRGVAAQTPATDAAVAATRHQVVTYAGHPVTTFFFSSSGGHTENIENVWPGAKPEPWLRGVVDRYDGAAGDPYHRWRRRLAPAAAAVALGARVRGRLVGIKVVRHGSSPRILLARIVGTKGSTTVTGLQLQRAFGLLTTDAWFTTISTRPAAGSDNRPGPGSALTVGLPRSPAAVSLLPLVDALTVGSHRALKGFVFPARRDSVSVQRRTRGHWRTVERARLGVGGRYEITIRAPGRYRIIDRGIPGPTVRVG